MWTGVTMNPHCHVKRFKLFRVQTLPKIEGELHSCCCSCRCIYVFWREHAAVFLSYLLIKRWIVLRLFSSSFLFLISNWDPYMYNCWHLISKLCESFIYIYKRIRFIEFVLCIYHFPMFGSVMKNKLGNTF